MFKTVVLLSGGIDSSTLAYHLVKEDHDLHALTINYGQRHSREIKSAMLIAKKLDIPWNLISIGGLAGLLPGNQLTGGISADTPVVPNRNAVLLSIAASVAIGQNAQAIAFAAHAGDYDVFPDCRMEFIGRLQWAINGGSPENQVEILTPFLWWPKLKIITHAVDLGVPLEDTWTCYRGIDKHCGECSACQERKRAFIDSGEYDPTNYRSQ